MLNRRNLRIKVLQSLFAFEQCCEADFELAKDYLIQRFSPDLNSMEVQDKDLLKTRQNAALTLFDQKFKGKPTQEADEVVVSEVEKALTHYKKNKDSDFRHLKKATIAEIIDLENIYHSVLNLFSVFSELAEAEKRINHQNFSKSKVIQSITGDKSLARALKNPEVGWSTRMDLVRSWFRDIIKKDSIYQDFISRSSPGTEEELSVLRHILRKIILGDTTIGSYFESKCLRWVEDKEVIKGLVEKTLKTIRSDEGFHLQKLSLEWEEDKFFIENLFEKSAFLPDRFHKLIAANTVNWEVERLPLTDRVILQMAIIEFITFPNVPIKVTINEYIELAKEYSTPKSRQFINGILDVLARELKKSGDLKKTGRGLIDNK